MSSQYKIILFDGICNLCNGAVSFFITRDKKNIFRFASLQSDIGIELQKKFGLNPNSLESFILIEGNKYYCKSTAALRLTLYIGFPYYLLFPLIIIPPFIRNIVYDIISRYRYRWFGKRTSCRIPTADEQVKFL